MFPSITTRLTTSASQAARRYISTTTPKSNTLAHGAQAGAKNTSWKWSNLSPQNRRYAIAGIAAVGSVDVYLHYTYWPYIRTWFTGEEVVEN
ncbi:Ff.00g047150.m01.CDS01 [Fusarium sp. VM40]|nr:Ff.00g047150.m01.CDS01 [Fusarium sp. VM40]